jgi:hypothetical protein
MECIKFSFIFLSLFFIGVAQAQVRFSPKSCLDAEYKMTMVQKGPLFGLLKHEFIINKKNCIVHVTHNKYIPKEWIIDVCREPVHIKVITATGVDVAKKTSECGQQDSSKDTSDFCSQYQDLMDVIQDDGLIFAEGDRDNLDSNHGKTFCSYLLAKRYLNDSMVLSRYSEVPDIFLEKPKTPALPANRPPSEEDKELKKEEQEAPPSEAEALNSVTSSY